MNVYIEILFVIFIILLVFYFLPFFRPRHMSIDQERVDEKVPGGEEEYYRMLKEGKKYRERIKNKN